jgi:hypothetical protein
MSEGLINVTVDGSETFYLAHCQCGWCGVPTSAIELVELDLRWHFDRAHTAGRAA